MIYARKISILSLVGSLLFIIILGFLAVLNINTGHGVAGIVCGGIMALMVYMLASDCRGGIRRPNTWEWFKAWMCVRPVLVGALAAGMLLVGVQLFSTPIGNVPPNPSANSAVMAVLVVLSLLLLGLMMYFQ